MGYYSPIMKTIIEEEGPTRRKLLIEVEPEEYRPLVDTTLRRLATEVKVPGFRKGKVPRAILEGRLGRETIREEVLRDAVPSLYTQAAREESVKAVSYPDIEVISFVEGEQLRFSATVDVRPEITLPIYKGIKVRRPPTDATAEEVDAQLDRLRERLGILEPAGRAAVAGDHVTIDIYATAEQERIDSTVAEGLMYEAGSGGLVPELDAKLEGSNIGDEIEFDATLPERFGPPYSGQEVTFHVTVRDIQIRRLAELDDAFAKTASEFDTLEELRSDIATRITEIKKVEAEGAVRQLVLADLLERVDVPVPASIAAHETEHRLTALLRDLERAGVTLERYLEANETTEDALVESYREVAERNVAADLVLDVIVKQENLELEREELAAEIASLAQRSRREPEDLLKELASSGRVEVLAGDILRRKALEFLVENAEIETEPLLGSESSEVSHESE